MAIEEYKTGSDICTMLHQLLEKIHGSTYGILSEIDHTDHNASLNLVKRIKIIKYIV